jgi:hypothetical protein
LHLCLPSKISSRRDLSPLVTSTFEFKLID